MILPGTQMQVYLAPGATDMRKQIDGLAAMVSDVLGQDPFSSALFVFCNQRRDKLKLLFWHRNGFWLWYRRLERGRFHWPRTVLEGAAVQISTRELGWLLEGLDLTQVQGHEQADFELL